MNARDILNNADPQELRNIVKHLKPGRSAVSMIIINDNPQQYPPTTTSTGTDLEWFNVKDYGAIGDGTNDDTAAITNTITAMTAAGRGVLYFPPGTYLTTGGFTISVPCIVMGMGEGNENTNAISEIRCNSATAVLFTVTALRATFEGLSLVNVAGSTPSAGSAIKAAGASYLQKVNYVNVSVYSFYINIDVQVGFRWLMDHCYLHAPVLYGLKVQNTLNNYRGGWIVSNSFFAAGLRNSNAAIRVQSGNGGKIVNCNVNCGEDLYSFNHGVDVVPGAANLQSLLIANCDIVNVRGNCVHVDATGGNTWDLIFISNGTFIVDTSAVSNANSPISLSAANVGDVDSVTIASCLFSGRATTPAITLNKIDKAEIVANVNENMSTLVSQTSCTNIVIVDPGTSVTTETSFGQSSSAGTSSYFAREDHTHGTPALSTANPQPIGTAAAPGSGTTPSKNDHVHVGVHSLAKSGGTALYGDVTISAGTGVTITPSGNNLQISSTSGGKYRQFTYTVSGGDFSFIIDANGEPVMALQDLE